MLFFKAACLILLLGFPGFALAEDVANAPEDAEPDATPNPVEENPAGETEDGEEPPMDEEKEEEGDEGEEAPSDRPTREQLSTVHTKADVDGNGKLSVDEVVTFVHETRKEAAIRTGHEVIESADEDKDGKISLDELMKDMYGEYEAELEDENDKELLKGHKVNDGRKFKAADKNGDGLLDAVEQAAFFAPEFDDNVLRVSTQIFMEEKDVDEDGLLTFDEFSETKKTSDVPANETDENVEKEYSVFQKLDKDGSGKLDVDEMMVWQSEHLFKTELVDKFIKAADTDGDSHMTIEELDAAHETGDSDEHMNGRGIFMEMVQHHDPSPEEPEEPTSEKTEL